MDEKRWNEMSEPVQIYLTEIRKLPPLTEQERQELISKIIAGDEEARDRLLWDYLEMVVPIAREYEGHGMHLLDLIQAGNNGLMYVGKSFDWFLWDEFPEYAEAFIRREIVKELSNICVDRRIPTERLEVINRMMKTRRRLEQELGREPAPREIMEAMDMPQEQIDIVLNLVNEETEAEEESGEQEEKSPARILYEMCRRRESTQTIREHLAGQGLELTERECTLLELRFGLDGNDPKTMEEAAEILGITRERVRQIESRILRRLGHGKRRKKIRDFYN